MEYLIYAAVILAGVLLCALAIRSNRPLIDASAKRTRIIPEPVQSDESPASEPAPESGAGLGLVRTPWGWPGSATYHAHHHDYLSASTLRPDSTASGIHQWVDHLVSSKQTTQDEAYQRHREMCLRALLEDRFHNSTHVHKLAPGYDENPHSSRTDAPAEAENKGAQRGKSLNSPLSELRTPWGW